MTKYSITPLCLICLTSFIMKQKYFDTTYRSLTLLWHCFGKASVNQTEMKDSIWVISALIKVVIELVYSVLCCRFQREARDQLERLR